MGDLYRVGDQAHADDLSRVAVSHPVGGACEAHRSRGVDLAQDLITRGGPAGPGRSGPPIHPVVIFGQVPAGMGGDQDPVVGDVEEPVDRLDGDELAGQMAPHVVAVLQDADPPSPP